MDIDGTTELYGIIGFPVRHSLSPALHNAGFAALGLNKVYLPFPAPDAGSAIDGLKALGVKGASVTIPHKEAVIPHLDEIDPLAERIGAVNTLVIENGRVSGSNTDWLGALRALEEKTRVKGAAVLLLGGGGSARAIGFGLVQTGARVVIANRNRKRGEKLAREIGAGFVPLAEAARIRADILINATSVGMESDEIPVPEREVAHFPVVMDIVYAPLETRLLAAARRHGCTVVDGLSMLLHQGVAQFELWTGQEPPLDVMREALMTALHSRRPNP